MATLIETLPKYTAPDGREVFDLTPVGYIEIGNYLDGYVGADWFKNVFPNIANANLPLKEEVYADLKNIGDCWEINAINWRKSGLVEVDGIPADEVIEEEEEFLAYMYPQPEETPEQPTETPEETPEGETSPDEENVPTEPETAPADEATEETPANEEETTEEA